MREVSLRLNVTFRIVILLLTTIALFLAVISINNKLNYAKPDSGLLAVKGDSFIHVTFKDPAMVQELSRLSYYQPNALRAQNLQVLIAITAENQLPTGDLLMISWVYSAENLLNGVRTLRYQLLRDQQVIAEFEKPFASYEQLFRQIDTDLGQGGVVSLDYLPDQQNSGTSFARSNIPVVSIVQETRPEYFIQLASGFAFLIIGFIIYFSSASRRLPHVEHFYMTCLGLFVVLAISFIPEKNPLQFAIIIIYKTVFLIVPAALLHFLYLLRYKGLKSTWSVKTALFYVPSALLILFNYLVMFQYSASIRPDLMGRKMPLSDFSAFNLLGIVDSFLFPIFIIITMGLLFHTFTISQGHDEKRQLKWLFWGIGLGLLPYSIFYFPLKLIGFENQIISLAVSLLLFITPFSFALAVFSLRFLDVEVIFKRSFVYLATAFSLLAVYLLLMFGVEQYSGQITIQSVMIISGGMILLATLVSNRIKDQVQSFFDRFLYRDFYNFRQTLQDFSVELSYERDLDKLLTKISERIRNTFNIPAVLTFITSANRKNFVLAHSTVENFEVGYINDTDSKFISEKLLSGKPLFIDEIEAIISANVFKKSGIIIFIPFLSLGEVIGFIGLSTMESGDILTTDELQLLSSLADRAGASIDNAMLYMDLQNRAEELRALKEFSENLVESVDSGIVAVDGVGYVQSWNPALDEMFGISADEALGRKVLSLMPPRLANVLEPYMNPESGTSRFHNLYKVMITNRREETKILNISLAPLGAEVVNPELPAGSQEPSKGTVIIIDDITDSVKMEEQLQQQEKMASLGLLAAGVAHELNTPLAGIAGYVQLLQNKINDNEDASKILGKVEGQAFRASKIINNLLSFSRQSASEQVAVNLNAIISESLVLLENQFKSSPVRVHTEFEQNLRDTFGNRIKLQQVIINLLLNARDSIDGSGEISIVTRNDGDYISCSISDTGAGIPAEVLPRIFDPFFTTKKIGQGTGLGLSVSYGIIQEHKGDITVASEINRGTTFTVTLPRK